VGGQANILLTILHAYQEPESLRALAYEAGHPVVRGGHFLVFGQCLLTMKPQSLVTRRRAAWESM